jgi:hypothetical protein
MGDAHAKGWEDDNRPRRFAQPIGINFCLLRKRHLTSVMGRTIMHLWIRQCTVASQLYSKESAMHSCVRRQRTAAGGICLWSHSPLPYSYNLALLALAPLLVLRSKRNAA